MARIEYDGGVLPQHVGDTVDILSLYHCWEGAALRVDWISPQEQFFILTVPGHNIGSIYIPTEHYLIEIEQTTDPDEQIVCEFEGRIAQAEMTDWKQYALRREAGEERDG